MFIRKSNQIRRNTETPVLTTPLGQVKGTILTSRLGKPIYSYRGIRYAQPPVKDLRFKPPEAIEKWEGIYNATEDGPLCPQPTTDPTSEDCLFVNVYSTKLPKGADNPKRPVIVFIHAGGFYSVGSASYWEGPNYFMDQDIVLVTFNYRLATLGMLSTGDREAPGNNGLKDQVMLLKWVKRNIKSFGGDPDNVTIMGYSAGDLFHKAVAMSGSPIGNWPITRNQIDLAKKQARFVGCPDDTSANIIKCLKNTPANKLAETLPDFKEFANDPVLLWFAVIEEDYGQQRFLPAHPIELIKNGHLKKVPFITGITADEFGARAFTIINNETLTREMNENFEKVAPISFEYERHTKKTTTISKALKKFYLQDKPVDKSQLTPLAQLYADSIIGFSVNRAVKLIAQYSNESVYYYRFSYQGRYSHFYLPDTNNTTPYGVVHHDDLIYLFYIARIFPLFKENSPREVEMVTKLTTLYANFAKTGIPIPSPTEGLDNVNWEPFTLKDQKYLDIGNKLVLKERLYDDRMLLWITLVGLLAYSTAHCGTTEAPLVTTPSGQLRGATITSRLGRTIYSFRGIRYAEPPVGDLRFKPPVAVEEWEGVYNATEDAPLCPQPWDNPISEDCLFVNVYSTKLPKCHKNPKRPVIVHILPGGFYSYGSASYWEGPNYFMDQDIVLVTFNYRLATLGNDFLSTGDKEAPGNLGMKDQVVLLKWVKKNIAAFGGDPDNVTIMGYSAGGWSVILHMVSPMSRGLFHKGVSMSGSSVGCWPLPRSQLDVAKKQARFVGCPDDTSENIIKCLKTVPYKDLADSLFKFAEFGSDPVLIWSPVIEEDFGQERFLPENPIKLIVNGKFQKVPFITGLTKNEFDFKAYNVLENATLTKRMNDEFEEVAPIAFIYDKGTEHSRTVSRAVRKFYFNDKPIDQSQLIPLAELYSDAIEGFPVNRAAKLMAQYSNQPVYYTTSPTWGNTATSICLVAMGPYPLVSVIHEDDLMYLFYIEKLFPLFKKDTPKEVEMVRKYTTIFANFAKTGKPIPTPTQDLDNVNWEPFTLKGQKYLEIGNKLAVKEKLHEERYPVWEKLYPIEMYLH
ncbi:hypothetical protein NQ318_022344 [Aromia moschata]|uniref:Carboxylesterase type B domain-containing protein n=1 Tax=Aromia moschata TaxID=1265417 RepID=A0AAV8Z6Q0_9CUCU|nr:hypothetical protein NQ318_022344 [Aromia moschata]